VEEYLTEEELNKNDGQDGRPAYIAYKGKVYNVSGSKLWAEGMHQRRHKAGQDLTTEFAVAPHDESVLQGIQLVGQLTGGEKKELHPLLNYYLDLHPHPIAVHFPIALTLVAAAFLVAHLVTGIEGLVDSAYYTLLAGVITSTIAMVTGVSSWWFNYGHRPTRIFVVKASLTAALFVLGITATTLLAMNRTALVDREGIGWLYFALVLAMSVLVIFLGKLGGELVFPSKKKRRDY
jgi:predicted heme/steroid binding protein/uncharacterized membrane protein